MQKSTFPAKKREVYMKENSLYEDIAQRTDGDIYIGVVGPVRTGKSTFIKRFMEKFVIPYVETSQKKRMVDELPQSAFGKTIMTTEPKFVPSKSAQIQVKEGMKASVRLVDCVGFPVLGATGFEEEGKPRLVKTPWNEEAIPFDEAAILGTQKVIRDHSTVAFLMTTDGSITDLPRESYVEAEERTVEELSALQKPFIVLLNCKYPTESEELRASLQEKYGVTVVAINVEEMDKRDFGTLLQKVLFEFPVQRVDICFPAWIRSLGKESRIIVTLLEDLKKLAPKVQKMKDCELLEKALRRGDFTENGNVEFDLGKGVVKMELLPRDGLFHEVLGEECGEDLSDDDKLMRYVTSLAKTKRSCERLNKAFEEAKETGYGVVEPCAEEMELEEPKLFKKGTGYGVRFRGVAPSYQIVKIDVTGTVSPIVGAKQQGEAFATDVLSQFESGDQEIWNTNIFGKNLRELLSYELEKKTENMPAEVKKKMRRTITRIVNEGRGGVICILL